MPARYALSMTTDALRSAYGVSGPGPMWLPSWNVAPGQPAPVIRRPDQGTGRALDLMFWGLVPSWTTTMDRRSSHARCETLAESGMFRAAFRSRRCLIPATAFYGRIADRPYACARRDGQPLAFAGLWDLWGMDGDTLRGFAVVTTDAPDGLLPGTARFPVLLPPEAWEAWLNAPPREAQTLMHPASPDVLRCWPISGRVRDPAQNDAHLLDPLAI